MWDEGGNLGDIVRVCMCVYAISSRFTKETIYLWRRENGMAMPTSTLAQTTLLEIIGLRAFRKINLLWMDFASTRVINSSPFID